MTITCQTVILKMTLITQWHNYKLRKTKKEKEAGNDKGTMDFFGVLVAKRTGKVLTFT